MYFHTLFHPHVFSKNTNNVPRKILPNEPFFFSQQCLGIKLPIDT